MKRLLLVVGCAALLTSCGNKAQNQALKAQNDSLSVALAEREAELDGILGAFNEVEEGDQEITEGEKSVDF